jgi:hypothetical protein
MSFVRSTTYTSTSTGISTLISAAENFIPQAVAVNGNYIFILNGQATNADNRVIYSTNAGSTWNNITNSIILDYANLRSISVSQNGHVLVCGNSVYYSTNVGKTFVRINPPSDTTTVGTISNDGSTLYVGNCGGSSNKNYVWTSNISNPNNWTVAFGATVSLYNSGSYKDWQIPDNNSAISTNSDGTYLIGSNFNKIFLGINNVFSDPLSSFNSSYWESNAISNTGQFMAFLKSSSGIWYSTNYGMTFTNILSISGLQLVTIDKDDGKIICGYLSINSSYYIYYSTNRGATFTSFQLPQSPSGVIDIKYNSSNSTLYVILYRSLLTYTIPILPPTVTINGTTVVIDGTVTEKARTKTVTVAATSRDLRTVSSITGTTNLQDDLNTIAITMSNGTVHNVYVMVLRNCFKEGTKILCLINDEEKYVPIEQMKEGTLVKTRLNGFVPVHTIGHSKIYNPSHNLRGENRLYKRTKEQYPELVEDLIVTGCHSVLVEGDRITPEILKKTKEIFRDDVWVTDNKLRLPTCLDDLAEPYQEEGVFNIWHFALDHFDIYMNYGVWANGLLMETCSINMMREYSGLELV